MLCQILLQQFLTIQRKIWIYIDCHPITAKRNDEPNDLANLVLPKFVAENRDKFE